MSENEARVALVTGGTRGIGSAISRMLAKDGVKVVAVYNSNAKAANAYSEQAKAEGLDIDVRQANIANPSDCQTLVDSVVREYGRIDWLVNNAGIVRDRTAVKMNQLDWDQVIKTNLSGPFWLAKAALPYMYDANYGRIVNISSFSGALGRIGQSNYAAAKSGLFGLTKTLALESATKGVTVNCIIPGAVTTEMTQKLPQEILDQVTETIPMRDWATGDDIADAVRYLCSDGARYITGVLLPVTGGLLMI